MLRDERLLFIIGVFTLAVLGCIYLRPLLNPHVVYVNADYEPPLSLDVLVKRWFNDALSAPGNIATFLWVVLLASLVGGGLPFNVPVVYAYVAGAVLVYASAWLLTGLVGARGWTRLAASLAAGLLYMHSPWFSARVLVHPAIALAASASILLGMLVLHAALRGWRWWSILAALASSYMVAPPVHGLGVYVPLVVTSLLVTLAAATVLRGRRFAWSMVRRVWLGLLTVVAGSVPWASTYITMYVMRARLGGWYVATLDILRGFSLHATIENVLLAASDRVWWEHVSMYYHALRLGPVRLWPWLGIPAVALAFAGAAPRSIRLLRRGGLSPSIRLHCSRSRPSSQPG